MAVTAVTTTMAGAINYTVVTDTSADWASVPNSTYFYDKADKLVHYKDGTGAVLEIFGAGGLTYFTEAQNTSAPNATVPVDSLTAVSAATNADVAILPKGTGALLAAIPDSTITGGNKRGTNAIDLQTTRTNADQVASGNSSIVIGTNSKASANQAVAIGTGALANQSSVALNGYGNVTGANAIASGVGSFAVNGGLATNSWSFAMGRSSATGLCSFAFGGYYAPNTASGDYGSVAIGEGNAATGNSSIAMGSSNTSGANAVALGQSNTASGSNSTAIGYSNSNAGGQGCTALGWSNTITAGASYGAFAVGQQNTVSGQGFAIGVQNNIVNGSALGQTNTVAGGVAIGLTNTANGANSIAIGRQSSSFGIKSRVTFAAGQMGTVGDSQASKFILQNRTTDTTATTLILNYGDSVTPYLTNQVILSNNSAYGFTGTIVGKQSGSTNAVMYKVEGLIARGASPASTVLTTSTVTLVSNAPGWGVPTLTADTTYGALLVQVIGAAATNIQWTAVIDTTEVIYA